MREELREHRTARRLNLLVPGAGLVLLGSALTGLVIAAVFAASANFVLIAALLIPDDVTPWLRGLGIGVTGGSYVGAQIRFAQTVRRQRQTAVQAARRRALALARANLQAGDYVQAWEALRPVSYLAADDLLVAYRIAQVLTGKQDVPGAQLAWQRVRDLDKHHIYRRLIEQGERQLRSLGHAAPTGPGLLSDDA